MLVGGSKVSRNLSWNVTAKIGDKICNVGEMTATQPAEWPLQRKLEYLDWAKRVVSGCRDCNPNLVQHFDAVLKESRESLRRSQAPIAK